MFRQFSQTARRNAMSKLIYKTFAVQRKTIDRDAGIYEAMISTEETDRDGDVIRAAGMHTENYLHNPIVLAGHNYRDMDAVIGKTLEITKIPGQGVRARFQFASAEVNPQAEMVRRLWDAEFLNATSIGFIPIKGKPMPDQRGNDFEETELLEFSVVSVPSNQSALAIRVVKGFDMPGETILRTDAQGESIDSVPGRAWVRRAVIESERGTQSLFVSFYRFKIDVPEDAELMQLDPVLGGCTNVPHPDAGKTVWFRQAVMVPPLEFKAPWEGGANEAVYGICERDCADDALIASPQGYWHVAELSDVLSSLPLEKAWQIKAGVGFGINLVTRGAVERAKAIGQRLAKRGRVLSAKNEGKIRAARDNLNEVLAEVEEQPLNDESAEHPTMPRAQASSDHIHRAEVKDAIPPHETPKADEDAEWDAAAVLREIEGEEKLRLVHAWVGADSDPDVKGSYKLPHHYADGRVVWRGVAAAGTVLMGGRGGADIPDDDTPGVKAHLARHYEQFDKTPPWEKGEPPPQSPLVAQTATGEGVNASEPGGQEKELLDGLKILTTLVKEVIT
jgi:hypothetical protein